MPIRCGRARRERPAGFGKVEQHTPYVVEATLHRARERRVRTSGTNDGHAVDRAAHARAGTSGAPTPTAGRSSSAPGRGRIRRGRPTRAAGSRPPPPRAPWSSCRRARSRRPSRSIRNSLERVIVDSRMPSRRRLISTTRTRNRSRSWRSTALARRGVDVLRELIDRLPRLAGHDLASGTKVRASGVDTARDAGRIRAVGDSRYREHGHLARRVADSGISIA